MRIVLADDHHLVRAGIRGLLEDMSGINVVAETGDGREALELIETHRPDVALLDITMPGMNGLEIAGRATKASPATRVVILSMHADEIYVAQALRAGVAGYLLKDAAAAELELALTAVRRGETYLSPEISKRVIDGYLRADTAEIDPLGGLTARQREILQLIAEGNSNKQIAGRLEVSVKTVETHRAQIMDRLEIRDLPGLVRFAIRSGLISPES
ncbi:MAG: response regulator transcription factor [bacterium]|nr:response regulator transcription factor [bacterium]